MKKETSYLINKIKVLEKNIHKFNKFILKNKILSVKVDTNKVILIINNKSQKVEKNNEFEEIFHKI